MSFLSETSRKALGDRLRTLVVNFPKMAVDSLAERLRVVGFKLDGEDSPALWSAFERAGMEDGNQVVHTEALASRRSFVIVWADSVGRATISVESCRDVAVQRDPVTGEVLAALKRWKQDGKARCVLFLPRRITEYVSTADVPEGGVIPPDGWAVSDSRPNPLGNVPVVPFVNRGRVLDAEGVSEMSPILDLTDAAAKLLSDLLVTSEYYARPKRFVTGLEVKYELDEDGEEDLTKPLNPFNTEGPERMYQAEDPETRFGQFDAARLDGYGDAIATLTQQIGALTGLPPHYLGLHGDQPASADAIRSAEAALVAKAYARQRMFGPSWAQVARLIIAVEGGAAPGKVEVVWANPETRTPAQAADAASKLVAAGILPVDQALSDLGYTPEQVDGFRAMRARVPTND